jgi:hypothetical protein
MQSIKCVQSKATVHYADIYDLGMLHSFSLSIGLFGNIPYFFVASMFVLTTVTKLLEVHL